jgi:hypothetical protein
MYFQENRKQCKFHKFQFYDQSDPFVKFCICGKRQDGNEPKKTKFNNRQTEYGGVVYHSQKEADYAAELDLRLRANDIESWERQVRVPLEVNGQHICNYYLDFLVHLKNGKKQWVEVKGFETEVWRLKKKLFEAAYIHDHPDEEYLIVK